MRRLRQIWRRLADTTGTNLIEAAIITPLLLLLTFSIVDFASLLLTFLALENGVSQATRYAITGQSMDDPGSPGTPLGREASIKAAMRNATPSLTIADGSFAFAHMSPGGSTWAGGAGGPEDIGKVTVTYSWLPLTPVLKPFLTGGKMSVSVESSMKNEPKFN